MSQLKDLPMVSFLIVLAALLFKSAQATTIQIKNNCPNTVWGAAVPGGGRQMNPGATWNITAAPDQISARIWARTGCKTAGPNKLQCNTGDCGGLVECTAFGTPPNTAAEFALNPFNSKEDLFDISLLDGFNVPMSLTPISNGCTAKVSCSADLNAQCPNKLRSPGGCNDPCTVFKTDPYCCTSGNCVPTKYSQYFKSLCPEAVTLVTNADGTSGLTCPSGTNYMVTFCP